MLKHRSSSGRINSSNFFPNKEVACQHNLMRSNGHNGNVPADRMLPHTSDGIFDECSNHAPGSRLGTSDAPVRDGNLSSYNGQLTAVGHTSSYAQPLVDIEEMYDKELEEAQDLRRRCELEERNALKAYRSAQRALLDANEKCNILYQKRTLFLAQLRACMMVDSSSLWHQRCNNHEETELDSLKNVAKSNMDKLPSSSCPIQAHVSNVQCTDGAPIVTAYQNINGHDSGADPCSEPDASTSELGHHKDNSAADGVLSPSNDPDMSADEEEEMFPPIQSRLICDSKKEKLEEGTMDMSQGSAQRCFIENAQDSALLEASLRSKLCARLGIGTLSRSSGSCLNAEPSVDKGADDDLENKKTHTITRKLSFLSDLPFLNAEQAQMDDTEGLGRHGSKTFQVSSHIHDQNYCDKFSSDYGSHRSTERSEPEESSSSFKESLRPTFASFSPLPSSVPKIVFRHVKVLAPDGCEVFQTSNDKKEHSDGIILKKVGNISCNDNRIDACGAHTSSNCAGEAKTGTLDSCDLTIDPFWPHCMFELRGKCNNDECTWQHVRDYNKKNIGQLNDYANSEGWVSPVLALGRFADACGIQHSPHHHIMPVPTYRIGTSLMKADAHSYGCLFARSVYQYWQWDFCTSFAVPFSVQRILPPDVPSLHAGDGCIKEHGYWNGPSLYFHNPDNKMEQDKQVSAAAEQSLESALHLFHGSANKQDGKKKALTKLSAALKVYPTSLFLWIVYLHIYYRKEKAIGKDDMFHFAEEKLWSRSSKVEGVPLDLEPGDSIKALDYLMEKEAVIIGTTNGYLLLHMVDDNTTEVVGKVEGGVKNIAPSPDGAVLAVTTGLGQILVMTHDWEVLYETMLDPPELDSTMVSGDMIGSPDSIFESHISWRGDGKYFATLSGINTSPPLQKLRIWERESGTLHAASEPKAFMGSSLDWMPSGAKIVTAYDRKDEDRPPSVVFFEKNGLERSTLSIDEPIEATVDILKWNCVSDLLAAAVRCEGYDAIKLWSFSNNHWYLKQEMRYVKEDIVKFTWDPTKPLQLICWTLGGKINTYNFTWNTAIMDNSTAFVIDNANILVSPLTLSLMPPPMSLFNLKFPCAVQEVAFFSKSSKNHLAVCLSDGSLCVVELPMMDTWEQLEGNEFIIEASHSDKKFGTLRHLIWLDLHILLGVSHCEFSENESSYHQEKNLFHGYSLQEIELVCSENAIPGLVTSSGWNAKVLNLSPVEGLVVGIVPNPVQKQSAFVQFDGGSIVEYSSKLSNIKSPQELHLRKLDYDISFSSSCPWMNAVPVFDNDTLKPLFFGLDESGRLQVSRKVLCHNCCSFSFYSNTTGIAQQAITHLILTTKQDLLFIIDINDILHGNPEVKFDNRIRGGIKNKQEENSDSINIWERGAQLIGVIHGDEAAVVLQTTRGNLECIYPRKLVLVAIISALVQKRFKDAMLMVRRHRIDFNVIVDHCGWQNFLQSSTEFVTKVNNLTHITEFICSIKNENVMETLYKNVISLHSSTDTLQVRDSEGLDMKSKISCVLLAIKTALEDQLPESPARELCILTALARSEPPALEEALKRVKAIREMELLGTDNSHRKSCPSAEESLKHLLWLSDPKAVYDAALGLYDLNLAAIVALNSQKDPKEFLPFLQSLQQMPPLVMQYTIDLRLQRYENALKHIFSAGQAYYEDCMNLMKNNPQLFPLGVQLFTDGVKRSQVLEAWGDHLFGEKCYEDAATAYLCCSSLQKALEAYRACGHWKGVLSVAGLLKLGKDEVLQLANELCEELQALGMPAEAARIALDYCGDVAGAIGYFVTAREWEEALRIGFMHRREDLISEIKNSAMDCASMLMSEFEEGLEKVGKYLARYLAVRQRRLVLAAKLQLEDRSIDDVDDDSASESSSVISGMSAYTGRTDKGSGTSIRSSTASKARGMRRQKHKGGKIRAGSPGEEMALVEHLKGMALTAGAERELKSLLHALVMLGKEETARKLQRVADTFQMSQRAAVVLAEDTISNNNIDEKRHCLEHYVQKLKGEFPFSEALSWQSKVLLPLQQ